MTDAELDAIEARGNAATCGPWRVDAMEMYIHGGDGLMVASNCPAGEGWQVRGFGAEKSGHRPQGSQDANAAFISAARSDVPQLVEEVRRLRGQLAEALQRMTVAEHKLRDYEGKPMLFSQRQELARLRDANKALREELDWLRAFQEEANYLAASVAQLHPTSHQLQVFNHWLYNNPRPAGTEADHG